MLSGDKSDFQWFLGVCLFQIERRQGDALVFFVLKEGEKDDAFKR